MDLERWRYLVPLRLRSLFRRKAVERDLEDEFQYHIEHQIELNVARGMTPAEARRAALRAMGGIEQHKEACRDQRRVQFADIVLRDTHHGLRLLGRSPVFTIVAILSLALGIGANAAIFHLIDALQLRSLAIANPRELAEIRVDGPQAFGSYENVNSKATYPLWEVVRDGQSAFSALFAWGDAQFLVGRGREARGARGLWVSGSFFPVLGIAPRHGRLLGPDDDRRGCGSGAAVISHAFWQTYFGGRESAIGSALTLRDRPFTIVGVAPASFTGLEVGETFDVALPLCSAALWDDRLDRRDRWWLTIMGRIKPDWTIARANDHLRAASQGFLDATIPAGYDSGLVEKYRRLRFGVLPAERGVSRLRETHGTPLSLLLGLTGLVLLITCGNLATLMLARASTREREIAVRVAIGASRARLVSQMVIESLLVAAGGAALAVPLALLSGRALVAFLETPATAAALDVTVDWRLLAFIGAIALLAAVLFGLVPALRVSMVDPISAMRQTTRGLTIDRHRARFQRGLVVAQLAVSLVLIFSALLFIPTFRNLAAVDPGFDPERTVAIMFTDRTSAALSAERKTAFQEQLAHEIRSVPGVAAAASSTHIPLSGAMWSHFFRVTGMTGDRHKASRFAYVGPGYFDTLKIPIRSGRDFNALDHARSRRVMLINESFARGHLNGHPPIGAIVRTIAEAGFPETSYEIIGVVGDTKYADLRDEDCWCATAAAHGPMPPIAYVAMAQNPSPYAWAPVMVRSDISLSGVTAAIGQRIARLDPEIVVDVVELKGQIRERLVRERMIAWIAGAFGLVAMTLVAVGLYGITAYLSACRRNEIGIRLALGSTRAQIAGLVIRENVWLMTTGLAIGLPLALAVMRGASALLFGLTPTDGATVMGAASLLAAAGALAAALPAWRASRIRADEALRFD